MDMDSYDLEGIFDAPDGELEPARAAPELDPQASPSPEKVSSVISHADAEARQRTHVFVDADNQSPAFATALLRFLTSIGRGVAGATVAGNGSGDRVMAWQRALSQAAPGGVMTTHVAPMRKQSADVRLMFELARLYHGQPDPALLVVVVSRDELLLAAAECLSAQGHHVLLAVGASSPAMPLVTDVPVVVLPVPQASVPAPVVTPPTASATPQSVSSGVDSKLVAAAVAKIRQSLTPHSDGGYAASAVGQVLSQLGYDKPMRSKIVAAIPKLRETGTGADKRLIF